MIPRARSIIYIMVLSSICLLNKYHILYCDDGTIMYFMRCDFNDIFGSVVFLLILALVLSILHIKINVKLLHVLIFMLFIGILWEYVTPLYRSDTTTDVFDIFAYLSGALLFWYVFGGKVLNSV